MKGFPAGGIRLNGVIFGRASQDEVETAKEALRSWPKIDRVTLHYFEVLMLLQVGHVWHVFCFDNDLARFKKKILFYINISLQ